MAGLEWPGWPPNKMQRIPSRELRYSRVEETRRFHTPHKLRPEKGVRSIEKTARGALVRAGSRTYFIDVEKTAEGQSYIKITESRFQGEGKERTRASIVVFSEHARKFASAVLDVVTGLR